MPDPQLCWHQLQWEGLATVKPPPHFLEFIQVNSFLIIPVLQFAENNHQDLLLRLQRRLSIVSPFFQLRIYGLQILFIHVNSCHLINSGAELELLTPTLPSICSNILILDPVAHLGRFPGTNIYGTVSSSINRIPNIVVSLLSVLDLQGHNTHTCERLHVHSHGNSRSPIRI